jgi:hypothetical protein
MHENLAVDVGSHFFSSFAACPTPLLLVIRYPLMKILIVSRRLFVASLGPTDARMEKIILTPRVNEGLPVIGTRNNVFELVRE